MFDDITRPHVSQTIVCKLIEIKFEDLLQPPYSSNLSPTDYYFFKHSQNIPTGSTFAIQDQEKPFSLTSSNPDHIIYMLMELIDLCYVGKSTLIQTALISIKMN